MRASVFPPPPFRSDRACKDLTTCVGEERVSRCGCLFQTLASSTTTHRQRHTDPRRPRALLITCRRWLRPLPRPTASVLSGRYVQQPPVQAATQIAQTRASWLSVPHWFSPHTSACALAAHRHRQAAVTPMRGTRTKSTTTSGPACSYVALRHCRVPKRGRHPSPSLMHSH